MKRFFIFFIVIIFVASKVQSQEVKDLPNNKTPQLVRVFSVPHGDRSLLSKPSDSSEIIKYNIVIKIESAFFTLKTDIFINGVYSSSFFLDTIINKRVIKDETVTFEIIPDISNPTKMGLFINFPGMSCNSYLECDQNKQIKYKNIYLESSILLWNPLLICYVDDMQNNAEKLIEKYFVDSRFTLTTFEDIQSKILNHIEKCILVYYNLNDK